MMNSQVGGIIEDDQKLTIDKHGQPRNKTIKVHIHTVVTKKNIRSKKVEMIPYKVGGTTGRGRWKKPFSQKGLTCPECFRGIPIKII